MGWRREGGVEVKSMERAVFKLGGGVWWRGARRVLDKIIGGEVAGWRAASS